MESVGVNGRNEIGKMGEGQKFHILFRMEQAKGEKGIELFFKGLGGVEEFHFSFRTDQVLMEDQGRKASTVIIVEMGDQDVINSPCPSQSSQAGIYAVATIQEKKRTGMADEDGRISEIKVKGAASSQKPPFHRTK
jgi:hypothetical protein